MSEPIYVPRQEPVEARQWDGSDESTNALVKWLDDHLFWVRSYTLTREYGIQNPSGKKLGVLTDTTLSVDTDDENLYGLNRGHYVVIAHGQLGTYSPEQFHQEFIELESPHE